MKPDGFWSIYRRPPRDLLSGAKSFSGFPQATDEDVEWHEGFLLDEHQLHKRDCARLMPTARCEADTGSGSAAEKMLVVCAARTPDAVLADRLVVVDALRKDDVHDRERDLR